MVLKSPDMSAEEMMHMAIPSVFAEVTWKQRPYDWQSDIMNPLLVPGNRVCAATCNESGKTSFVITKGGLWYMMAFPGSVVVSTSASSRQIGQQLYPNIRACVKQLPDGDDWKVRDANDRYEVQAPNGSRWFSFTTKDAGRAEGYHVPALHEAIHEGKELPEDYEALVARLKEEFGFELKEETRLLLIIDEAKSVEQDIFDAFERCRGTNWLILSTPPVDPTGPFHDCFKTEAEKYVCKRTGKSLLFGGFEENGLLTYKQCPHLTNNKITMRNIALDYKIRGAADAFVGSMHEGRFPEIGQNMVFNMIKVREAMSGLNRRVGRDRAVACDYSRGGDEQIFAERKGNTALPFLAWREANTEILIQNIIKSMVKRGFIKGKHNIIGDDGGLGGPINDQLETRGWETDRFKFGGTARDPESYADVRAEGFFFLSKLINLNEVCLPDDPELFKQLQWHTYTMPHGRTRRIIKKEKMPHSPDRADAVMMVFYDFEEPEFEEEQSIGHKNSVCRGAQPVVDDQEFEDWVNSSGEFF